MSAEELQRKLKISDSDKCRSVSSKRDLDDELRHAKERKILIAVDGSDYSKQAFDFYINNLHRKDDIVILTHTLELPPKPAVPFPDIGKHYEEWHSLVGKKREESKQILSEYLEAWEQHGLQSEAIVAVHDEHGMPGVAIVELATDYHVSLIIVGTRGLGLIRRTILGSVSDYVIHHTDIPVAVVPKPDH